MKKFKGLTKYIVPAFLVFCFGYSIWSMIAGNFGFGIALFLLNAFNIYMFISNGLRELREQEEENDRLVH